MSNSNLYLVLDQGGHASRAMVFNDKGSKVASSEIPVNTFRQGKLVEHDASELVTSLQLAIKTVLQQVDPRTSCIVAAGLATQRSNMLCWRASDNTPLSPVISWQDRRAEDKLQDIDIETVREKTGLYANPHYGASKMAWCLEHYPEVQQAQNDNDLVMGPMASYLASCLTGTVALADPANASRTLLWNIHSGQWDDELCNWFGIDKSLLPGCVSSDHGFGDLSLPGYKIPLRIITGDLSAAIFANGLPREDVAYITLGTGGFIQRACNKAYSHPRLLDGMLWSSKDKQYLSLEGTVNGVGAAISWFAEKNNLDEATIFSQLQQWCESIQDVPLFYNTVSGLGSPAWCANEIPGFSRQASTGEYIVSIMESIIFLLYLNMQVMNEVIPGPASIYISGGFSNIDPVCQKLSDLFRLPVYRSDESEGTAKGLAFLLSGCKQQWETGYDLFMAKENLQVQQRYVEWLSFARQQGSADCLYFQEEQITE